MQSKTVVVLCLLLIGLSTAALAEAYPPRVMNYQGVLRDAAGQPLTGVYSMVFRLFETPTGGVEIFSDAHPSVQVSGGLFQVEIGPTSGPIYLPRRFADYGELYLQVEVQGEVLNPRTHIAAAPYAMNARYVNGIETTSSGPRDFYVDAVTGDDSNSGLYASRAKRTIGAAVERIPAILGGEVTIHIANGTYNEEVVLWPRIRMGAYPIRLVGNELDPGAVVLDGTGVPATFGNGVMVLDMPVELVGMTITSFADSGVAAAHGGSFRIRDCRLTNNLKRGITVNNGGYVEMTDCQVSGNVEVGVRVIEGGAIYLDEGNEVSSNLGWGLVAADSSHIEFGSNCVLSNNDLFPYSNSTIEGYNSCSRTNASCSTDAGDLTSRCIP